MSDKKENHFDKKAAEWDANFARKELTSAIAKAVGEMCVLTPEMKVLEYGCGTGNLSFQLSRHVGKIIAADSSRGMIEQLEKKIADSPGCNITSKFLDLTDGAVVEDKFDLIASAMTLHHVEDTAGLLKTLVSLLSEGGQLLLADLCEEDGSFHTDMTVPHNGFNPKSLEKQLCSIGMKNCKWKIVHNIERNARKYPIFAISAETMKRTA